MTAPEFQVFDTVEQFQDAAAEQVASLLRQTQAGHDIRIALSGGSTPRRLYELLSEHTGIDWSRVHVYWGDERAVGPDDDESNYRMAHEALLSKVSIPETQIYRIKGEIAPVDAAQRYEHILRETFSIGPDELPRFDLILLGMGPDGHTASLFPNTPALRERQRLVVANDAPDPPVPRITLTFPVLNASASVMFLVAGEDKASALSNVVAASDHERPPAAYVRPTSGELRWFLDQEAAKGIG